MKPGPGNEETVLAGLLTDVMLSKPAEQARFLSRGGVRNA